MENKIKGDRSPSEDGSILSKDEEIPTMQTGRRKSVFAEPYDPEVECEREEVASIIYPKTDDQRIRLNETVRNNLLFRSLDSEQINQLLDAMFEREVQEGDYIIRQGDEGDYFYVIEMGIFVAFVNEKLMQIYDNIGSFGELALMYNAPRAASIKAETDGKLWAIDRHNFRRILLNSVFKKRKLFEELLEGVPILKTLEDNVKMSLADALVTKYYAKGTKIIQQGDLADGMYFIEDGQVSIKIQQADTELEVANLVRGEYFGELALVYHRPRVASAYAVDNVKLAFLNNESFDKILGYASNMLKRNYDKCNDRKSNTET